MSIKWKLLIFAKVLIKALADKNIDEKEAEEILAAFINIFRKNKIAVPESISKIVYPVDNKNKTKK